MLEIFCKEPVPKTHLVQGRIEQLLETLSEAYTISIEQIFCSMLKPVKKYYLRVNLLKTDVDELVKHLRERGVVVQREQRIPEAIYIEVRGPNKIEDTGKYVIADDKAADRVMMGANLYLPGTLRIVNARKGDYVTIVSKSGDYVANGELRVNSSQLGGKKGVAVDVKKSIYTMPKISELPEYWMGYLSDQSYPSMTVVHALNPNENSVIADLTASPGGKVMHAYEYVRSKGNVFAFDHTWKKVRKLREESRRLGHDIKIFKTDSRYLHNDFPWLRPDYTLVDPPCTGLGNRPLSRYLEKLNDLENLVRVQEQLLREALRITVPGGIISYSTCTLSIEENEGIVENMVKEGMVRIISSSYPLPKSPFSELSLYRFVPGVHETPGLFIALLQKN